MVTRHSIKFSIEVTYKPAPNNRHVKESMPSNISFLLKGLPFSFLGLREFFFSLAWKALGENATYIDFCSWYNCRCEPRKAHYKYNPETCSNYQMKAQWASKWFHYTLKTNIAPENRPSQKESIVPTINFQGLCWISRVYYSCLFHA